jgi:ankyrin repeat protein
LLWACNDGHIDCARLLLDAGADPSLRNNGGYAAAGRIMKRNEELTRLLEEHGGSF